MNTSLKHIDSVKQRAMCPVKGAVLSCPLIVLSNLMSHDFPTDPFLCIPQKHKGHPRPCSFLLALFTQLERVFSVKNFLI